MSRSRGNSSGLFRYFWIGLYSLWLIGALAVGVFGGMLSQSEAFRESVNLMLTKQSAEDVFSENGVKKDKLTLLILGCDDDVYVENGAKKKRKGRSDMIMVAELDFTLNEIRAISIPRDVWVNNIPGVRGSKVNALYVTGGPELTKLYAEDLLGVKIDRIVDLDFRAFERTIDLLDGVDVFVPKRMYYQDTWADLYIDLQPGQHRLNGYEAMGFVRFRKSDSDLERQNRQKEFMLAVKNRIVARPDRLPAVADQAVAMLGNAFSARELAALALFAPQVGSSNIRMGMVPVDDIPGTSNLRIVYPALKELLTELRLGNPDAMDKGFHRSEVKGLLEQADERAQLPGEPVRDRGSRTPPSDEEPSATRNPRQDAGQRLIEDPATTDPDVAAAGGLEGVEEVPDEEAPPVEEPPVEEPPVENPPVDIPSGEPQAAWPARIVALGITSLL